MAKQQNTTLLLIVAIVAFGAGYFFAQQNMSVQAPTGSTSEEDAMESGDAMETEDNMEKKDGEAMEGEEAITKERSNPTDFTLTGYSLERGGVHLEWVVPDNRRTPERFMVVRDEEPNPEHTGQNFWYRQDGSVREIDWKDIPKGTFNFRVCILENDECVEYTNNVELEVK